MAGGRSVFEIIFTGNAQGVVSAGKRAVGALSSVGNAAGTAVQQLRGLSSAKGISVPTPAAPQFNPGDGSKIDVARGTLDALRRLEAGTESAASRIRTVLPQALNQASAAMQIAFIPCSGTSPAWASFPCISISI